MRADVVAALLIGVVACSGAQRALPLQRAGTAGGPAQAWITTPDRTRLLARQPDIGRSDDDGAPATQVVIDTRRTYQSMLGFGAAITDASAWLIQTRLTAAQRERLLQELYGRQEDGVGFSVARLTIGASDYSRTHYTLDDIAPGTRDDGMAQFSIAPNRADVLPVIQRALAINPALVIMATPWSAPAWMKSNHALLKGTLRPDAYPAYAEYLRRYVAAYEREGVPIAALSIQNEPHHEPADYPGMRFEAPQRAEFIGRHLGPLFARHGVRTALLDWDHNWDAPESPLAVLGDSVARRYVRGVAWHCYAGDAAAQSRVHDAFPDTEVWFTECAGGNWAPDFGDNLAWNTRTLIIGATRNWARTVMLWNVALDEQHGPHLGGCNDCRGVVTIDRATGRVTRNEEYYALAHASRFVRPGAVRVASTTGIDDIETVAFRNRDDGSLVLVAVNPAKVARALALRVRGQTYRTQLPAGAVATYVWR